MVEARLGKTGEAIVQFRKVIELEPGSSEGHLNLGIALADHLNLEGALAEFSEAVRLRPASSAAHYNKGRALFDLRRIDAAEKELGTAVQLDARAAPALYLLALCAKQQGQFDRSADFAREALAIDPRNSDAEYLLGQNLAKLGKESEAFGHWKKALALDPNHSEALYNLARGLSKTDPEASKDYQARFVALQQRRQMTDRAGTLANFALDAAAARDWEEAIAKLNEAVEVCGNCPSKADIHKDLGLIYCRSGNLAKGEQQLRLADGLKPNDPDITKSLAIIASLKEGKTDKRLP
jgi:tetratricopeptide (TPR) repeat protein